MANARERYGFPSSKLFDSDDDLLEIFLVLLSDKGSFLAFFLGWFMADGTIKWNWSGKKKSKKVKYICNEISSKNESIILWFEKRLNAFGGEVEVYKDSKQQTMLKIPNRPDTNNKLLLYAINELRKENIPMNGKLLWLEKF